MDKWKGQSRGVPFGYSIFIFLIKYAGVASAYLLARFVVLYYLVFSNGANAALKQYFERVEEYFGINISNKYYKTYFNFSQTLIDKTAMISGASKRITVDFDGEEHLKHLSETNTGGLLLSAHIGNWEAAGHLLHRVDQKINVVMMDREHEKIRHIMENAMGRKHFTIIPIKNDISHLFAINQAAQNKELICMHGDRFVPGVRTREMQFLGKWAEFPVGPFKLAAKLNLPVTFVYGMKKSKYHYGFYASAPITGETDYLKIMDAYKNNLEDMIKLYPTQWYNFYPFWKA